MDVRTIFDHATSPGAVSLLLRPLLYGTARTRSTASHLQRATARAARHAGCPLTAEGRASHADTGMQSPFCSGRSSPVSPLDKDARDHQHNSKSNQTKRDLLCLKRVSWNDSKVVFRAGSPRPADVRPHEQIDGQRFHYPRQRGSDENQKHARSYRPSSNAHCSNVLLERRDEAGEASFGTSARRTG